MKNIVKSTLMALPFMAALASTTAYAANDDWYAGVSGDLTWLRHSDTGGGGNVNVGYRFWPSNFGDFRLEAEAGYHGAGGSSGNAGTHYFDYMGNVYYDFNTIFPTNSWKIVPYIGGGAGDASLNYGHATIASTFHHHTNEFAYDGQGGLSFVMPSMPMTEWYVGYEYLGTDNHNIDANNAKLGVRFHF
jgi:hypothetical protein